MIKPSGPSCNLNCTYCFYLSKQKMFERGVPRMSEETLENLTRQYMGSQDDEIITFAWQGGEPTLAGLDFFRKALELQNKYCRPGMVIENTFRRTGPCWMINGAGFCMIIISWSDLASMAPAPSTISIGRTRKENLPLQGSSKPPNFFANIRWSSIL